MKKHKLAYIEWADAISSGSQWVEEENLTSWIDDTEWIIKQVGWVLREDEKCIVIAS